MEVFFLLHYFSDPFFSLKYKDPYGYFKPAYTSETIKDDLNPRWKPFSVVDSELCRGDYNAPLRLMVFDWDKVKRVLPTSGLVICNCYISVLSREAVMI